MSSFQKVALVTGANKGIGYAIVKLLSQKAPNVHILAGVRDLGRGEEALKKWSADGVKKVELIELDIANENSIKKAAEQVKNKFGGLDILINNAGMAFKGDAFDENVARTTIQTNHYGTLYMMQHFLPLLRDHARVSNVSSTMSSIALSKCSSELQQKFLKDDLTIEQLNGLMEQFITDVKNNEWEKKGWTKSAYGVSKIGVTMQTRIFARDNKREDVLINSCCPGWVRTDMAGDKAPKSPDEGATTPVHLALLPAGSEVGKLWRDEKVQPFIASSM